jgi:hypothetical protein
MRDEVAEALANLQAHIMVGSEQQLTDRYFNLSPLHDGQH